MLNISMFIYKLSDNLSIYQLKVKHEILIFQWWIIIILTINFVSFKILEIKWHKVRFFRNLFDYSAPTV